jgi:hypothetical protein
MNVANKLASLPQNLDAPAFALVFRDGSKTAVPGALPFEDQHGSGGQQPAQQTGFLRISDPDGFEDPGDTLIPLVQEHFDALPHASPA